MSTTPRLAGRVSEPIRQRPEILSEVELLRRDLGIEMDEVERLTARNKALRRKLEDLLAQVARQGVELSRLRRLRGRRSAEEISDAAAPSLSEQGSVSVGRLVINFDLRRLELNGQAVSLTLSEVAVLGYLAQRPNRVIDTSVIAAAIGSNPNGDAVRTYISRARVKLGRLGAAPYLQSQRHRGSGGGYWMTSQYEQGWPM